MLKNKMKFTCLFLFPLFLTLSANLKEAEAALFDDEVDVIEVLDSGEINWSRNLVRAAGSSGEKREDEQSGNLAVDNLSRLRKAKIEAIRNIFETVKLIRVDSNSIVKEYMAGSDYVLKTVHQIVSHSRIVEKSEADDDIVNVTVELSFVGPFFETIIPSTGGMEVPINGEAKYTGLIVDASGLGLKPSMSLKIFDERRREVYGPSFLKRASFLAGGVAVFSKNMESAMENERVYGGPFTVMAIRTSGAARSNLVISNSDAKKLQKESTNLSWMQDGRVIVIVD